jgi:hypothetical protein
MSDRHVFAFGKLSLNRVRMVTHDKAAGLCCYEGKVIEQDDGTKRWEGEIVGAAASQGTAEYWWRTGNPGCLSGGQ